MLSNNGIVPSFLLRTYMQSDTEYNLHVFLRLMFKGFYFCHFWTDDGGKGTSVLSWKQT
ncbi:hypothetical protein LINPERHAP1_LOCUS38542 [Linum perenne]